MTCQAVLLLLAMLATCCNADLVMVYSIQRHGARNVLPKSSTLKESEATGGPTLLPEGQRQCFEAGAAFNARYINPSSCNSSSTCLAAPGSGPLYGVTGSPDVGFSNYNTFANTSALDRTIMSADSFLAGVFPAIAVQDDATNGSYVPTGEQVVPVYSMADTEDWKIRGYTKCPAYEDRLQQWLASEEFAAKAAETQELRDKVQALAPQLNVSLANWWNVYDAFNVWKTYGVGEAMPPVDAATFAEINQLAMWLETSKMRPSLTSNLLGGGLLGNLMQRLAAAEAAVSAGRQGYYRFLSVSSHYNTQLGLLSALFADQAATQDHIWTKKIPSLAAVLLFELHASAPAAASSPGQQQQQQSFAVRAVYQDGPKAPYKVLPLPCAVKGDAAEVLAGPGACTLERFRALAGPQTLNTSREWCDACTNGKVMACQVSRMERQLAEAGITPFEMTTAGSGARGNAGSSMSLQPRAGYVSPVMVALLCVVSAALTVCVGTGVLLVRRHKQRKVDSQVRLAADTALPANYV